MILILHTLIKPSAKTTQLHCAGTRFSYTETTTDFEDFDLLKEVQGTKLSSSRAQSDSG